MAEAGMQLTQLFRRRVALPSDHGSWVFLLSPLLIGLFTGGRWSTVSSYLVVAALAGFLLRQPVTVAIKIASGRRPRQELPAAAFWIAIYAGIGLLHVAGLTMRGFGYILYLPLLGVPVFAWYLYLVAQHRERRQIVIELAATAVLSLSATAGFWIAQGRPSAMGWFLAFLVWLQTAASIVQVYLKLQQRQWKPRMDSRDRWSAALPAVGLSSTNLLLVAALCAAGFLSSWLFLAFVPQWLAALQGVRQPARTLRPTDIGLRQLLISAVFILLFLLSWQPIVAR
jgi:hypothetical protein